MSNGYESLKSAVIRDCHDRNSCGCFNPDGCDKPGGRIGNYGEPGYKACFHKYCDKFKWVIDRAKQYGEKLDIPWEDILDSWESDRDYWYMNYYQDCNQPAITGGKVRVFNTAEELQASVGNVGFRCPCCGGVSASPYACDSGVVIRDGQKCDWKVYGLFGDIGKGIFVYCKDRLRGETIFMPIAWENQTKQPEEDTH